ncbi:putative enterotoxin [Ophiocordyceps australis]|uniref:Putative enterotoxin n=1 Tax=Ophiocordyceps australis TaxID=1399860 RepID=A0A2C5YCR4_9HYPO|nr:putative enterotoxin [Ophiocordyceps australis]
MPVNEDPTLRSFVDIDPEDAASRIEHPRPIPKRPAEPRPWWDAGWGTTLDKGSQTDFGPTKWVFRGSSRGPDVHRALGGFLPNSQGEQEDEAFGFLTHLDDVMDMNKGTSKMTMWVSTSAIFGAAARFARHDGWVYKIHVAPNMVDVASTLGKQYNMANEAEFAALGGVHWSQVHSWVQIPADNEIPDEDSDVDLQNRDLEELIRTRPEVYRENPDYNAKWDSCLSGGSQPQLAGYEIGNTIWQTPEWKPYKPMPGMRLRRLAREFLDKNAEVLEWRGHFPLVISAEERERLGDRKGEEKKEGNEVWWAERLGREGREGREEERRKEEEMRQKTLYMGQRQESMVQWEEQEEKQALPVTPIEAQGMVQHQAQGEHHITPVEAQEKQEAPQVEPIGAQAMAQHKAQEEHHVDQVEAQEEPQAPQLEPIGAQATAQHKAQEEHHVDQVEAQEEPQAPQVEPMGAKDTATEAQEAPKEKPKKAQDKHQDEKKPSKGLGTEPIIQITSGATAAALSVAGGVLSFNAAKPPVTPPSSSAATTSFCNTGCLPAVPAGEIDAMVRRVSDEAIIEAIRGAPRPPSGLGQAGAMLERRDAGEGMREVVERALMRLVEEMGMRR